jgi:endonuclease/exonuclease/phosphatase family metal-dependent hydrolase
MTTSFTFSVLTFNSLGGFHWGTPVRLRTLASVLTQMKPTVACLQEVQSYPALRLLLRLCTGHTYCAYAPGIHSPLGGLLTLSQKPLAAPHIMRYQAQGFWFSPTLLDRISQKGALLTSLVYASVPIIVINTHLVANYWGNWEQTSAAAHLQQQQLDQLVALVQGQPPDTLVLAMGDFNIPRGSWLYEEFVQATALRDVLGDERPTYRPYRGIPSRFALPIDYVFVRIPPTLSVEIAADRCFVEPMPLVGGGQGYLSDHLGVEVKLQWEE